MTQTTSLRKASWLLLPFLALGLSFTLSSYTTRLLGEEFLKQLGLTKPAANEKISNVLLGGGVSIAGVKNAKLIPIANRTNVVKELVIYAKQHAASPAFAKQYETLRSGYRPKEETPMTPAQLQADMVDKIKKAMADVERAKAKAGPAYSAAFDETLVEIKKSLTALENGTDRSLVNHRKNYDELVQQMKQSHVAATARFLQEYPDNPLQYVKKRLQSFLDQTDDIDFAAETTVRNGKTVFVNREFESKSYNWKMAFRAGKEVILPARAAAEQWLKEIGD